MSGSSLNPLGIGEGFELIELVNKLKSNCLNPLGIGEGFEQEQWNKALDIYSVLIP